MVYIIVCDDELVYFTLLGSDEHLAIVYLICIIKHLCGHIDHFSGQG